ncbi:MAG: four helix bundle protein [Ignavibacteriaceae bacterium]|nr:four helix bundle protein [Ignavibacteriaceae bacterium]
MNENKNKNFNLEERLIDFAVLIIEVTENLNTSRAGNHIAGQLVRSGTAPALLYGEASRFIGTESRNDFIHKLKILLKELRETFIALKIIKKVTLTNKLDLIDKGMIECNELVSIFVKSIETARKNNEKKK